MLSTTSGMRGAVGARSPASRKVCDRATAELQRGPRSTPASYLHGSRCGPPSASPLLVPPVHGRSADATSIPRAFKSEALLSLKCRLERQLRLAVHRCCRHRTGKSECHRQAVVVKARVEVDLG